MNKMERRFYEAVSEAILARDVAALDLALRAELHYKARGRAIDTSSMKFREVLALDPKFYG